jgi:nucleoside-diphosphate-sugar epimerase
LMDITKLRSLGWQARISLEEGIKMVYEELMEKQSFLPKNSDAIVK